MASFCSLFMIALFLTLSLSKSFVFAHKKTMMKNRLFSENYSNLFNIINLDGSHTYLHPSFYQYLLSSSLLLASATLKLLQGF